MNRYIAFARQDRTFRWANVALLAITAAAMFGLIFSVYQTVESEREEREQVRMTNEVLTDLRSVSQAVLNAETGQRGYLITLDRRYLESYLAGREQIDPALSGLGSSLAVGATPRQQELFDRIETLAAAKFAELDSSVRLLDNGQLIEARAAVLSDEGHETMARLWRAIAEME
ncbi:MAG: CHASE3 domain-containing protein, partial [Alphaproteobacteria bacterium]|nr:CHASE3 domain-containing protein [Alphaproteobacteria bacterium]